MALPNENITWFKSKTFDIGFDFEGWDGLLGVSFDYFNRLRTGRFARRTGALPTVVGATAPRENLDSDCQFGMELELTHRNKIGEVGYNLKGIATVTRQKYLTASEKGLGPTRMIAGATTT
jgi:TonB dependent receptor.